MNIELCAPPAREAKRRRLTRGARRQLAGILFELPLILGLIIFTAYPVAESLRLSLYRYNGFDTNVFNGFNNFKYMFANESQVKEVLRVFGNTFIYCFVSVPLSLFLSYFLAMPLNKNFKGVGVFRLLIYLPVIIPSVVSALLYKDIFDVTYGVMNQIFGGLGLPQGTFFSHRSTAMATLIWAGMWNLGGGMILWLSAFKNIPASLYESAKIDGANPLRRTLAITLPMSTPMIFYNLVMNLINSMQIFNSMMITGGDGEGPEQSLYFIAVKIYNEAFQFFRMGYAAALSWILFLVVGLLTVVVFATSKWVFYGDE
ncbi:MAG: sugar ABC transporter permease [Clostridiales bacterium]|jgi:multiple sugar transport system permease protein|nr:sugar ABC transporter permease [Clostridiales bacterium]